MRYQISKQLDLWHVYDRIIPKPIELTRHLEINRRNASIIVEAIAKDFEATVEPIMEILRQGYQEQEFLAEEEDWQENFNEPLSDLTIEIPVERVVPIYSSERWDTLTGVLDWIEISEKLKADFTDKLLIECLNLISPSIFSEKIQEAIKLLDQQNNTFNQEDVIKTAGPLITSWIRETIESRGEALALYATMKLIINESNR